MPFGGTFNSYTSGTENNYLYNQGFGEKTFQGEEGKVFATERQIELDIDMTKFRMYDYNLGRFLNVDPLADQAGQELYTPYHYALNNPIRYSDPYGDCVGDLPCPQSAENVIQGFKELPSRIKGSEILAGFKELGDRIAESVWSGLEDADGKAQGNEKYTTGNKNDKRDFGITPVSEDASMLDEELATAKKVVDVNVDDIDPEKNISEAIGADKPVDVVRATGDSAVVQLGNELTPGVRPILSNGNYGRRRSSPVTSADSSKHKVHPNFNSNP